MTTRRFPPPWSVEELHGCFVVRNNSGQKLYVYFEEEPGGGRSKASAIEQIGFHDHGSREPPEQTAKSPGRRTD